MKRKYWRLGAFLFVLPVPVFAGQEGESFGDLLAEAAWERTRADVVYDPAYYRIDYPHGDVPADRGVCADVIIRTLRRLDIDLQQLIHEDMKANFSAYPTHWGLRGPDPNIDHRRVPNIERYLTRVGARQPRSRDPQDYQPGDIVAWNLRGESGGWQPHIGIVSAEFATSGRPLMVHNISSGPKAEDVLFDWPITGHYRMKEQGR